MDLDAPPMESPHQHALRGAPGETERLLLLARVGRVITGELHLGEILERTAEAIHTVLGFENVDLPLLSDGDPPELVVAVRGGRYRDRIRVVDRLPIATGVMGAAVREARTQVVPDVRRDPRYIVPPAGLTILCEVAVPILHGTRVLGVVNVESSTPINDLDVLLLELVADQLAIAIENARLFESGQRVAVLEERQRLARDLHDSVTQTLWSAQLLAESLSGTLTSDPERAQQRLDRLTLVIRQAVGEARSLLRELAPQAAGRISREVPTAALMRLRRDGLVGAVEAELANLGDHGLSTRLDATTWLRQSLEREEVLLTVTREALGATMSRQGGHQVAVTLSCDADSAWLRIHDDGEVATASRFAPNGLQAQVARVAALAGVLEVSARPGAGTTVEARFPR
jgi:signal transduction histidine kinase